MPVTQYDRNEGKLEQDREKDKQSNDGDFERTPMLFLGAGKTIVRILPAEGGVWYRESLEHTIRQAGKLATFTCPRTNGDNHNCPFCETASEFYDKKDEDSTEIARQHRPVRRYFANALCLSNPDGVSIKDGVKVLKFPLTVRRALLDIDMDVQGGFENITDLENGVNISIERTGTGFDTKYITKVIGGVKARVGVSQLLNDAGVDANSLDQYNLDELYPPKEYDALKEVQVSFTASLVDKEPEPTPEPAVTKTEKVKVAADLPDLPPPPPTN